MNTWSHPDNGLRPRALALPVRWFGSLLLLVVWMGYDNPRSLGDRETGGGLSLPVWISFMQTALKGVPVSSYPPPEGVVQQGSEWYYQEFARDTGVRSLSADAPTGEGSARLPATSPEERKSILDLFRN